MADIFDEVAEDLRRERYQRLLRRYGWVLAVLVLAALGGTAGWQVWKHQQRRAAEADTARLIEALRAPAGPEPAGLAEVARGAAPGPRTLARLVEAARRVSAGDTAGALALWQAVATDDAADRLYRDLATLLGAMHTLDRGDPAELEARLRPLAAPGNAWRHNAAELLALLAERRGDRAQAIAGFRALATDAEAPPGIRARADQMLTVLGAGGPAGRGGGAG